MLTHQSDIIFQTSTDVSPSVGKEQKLFSGSRELCENLLELTNGMQRVFGTETGDVTFCAGSSVEAWDQAITSTLNEGDKVLVLRIGAASASLEAQVAGLGLDVEIVETPTGAGLPLRELSRRLGADVKDEIKAVFVTLDEALAARAQAAKHVKSLASRVEPRVRHPGDIPDLLSYQLVGGAISAHHDAHEHEES